MHEVLTVQLGHRANNLATHFWNAQESYFTYDAATGPSLVNSDIHFRPGFGPTGEETYTPRTLIYDLKGGFGGLRKWGGLYDQRLSMEEAMQDGGHGVWNGNVIMQQDPEISQSDYQRGLDEGAPKSQDLRTDTVRYWSDFNRVFYHPRSIVQINDYELGSSLVPFENWTSGEELFRSMNGDEDLLDRDFRPWAEECDQMQGIQLLTGADDAWGGFAAGYVESLRDEYGKTGIWVWGIEESHGRGQRAQQLLRSINAAKMINNMSMHSSMYIPLSVPAAALPQYVRLDLNSQWHTSALLSVAQETMSLPSRLRQNGHLSCLLGDLEMALNVNGNQRMAQSQYSIVDRASIMNASHHLSGVDDERMASAKSHPLPEEDDPDEPNAHFDIDLSGIGATSSSRGGPFQNHTFGAIECLRGQREDQQPEIVQNDDDELAHSRNQRRFAGMAVMERSVIQITSTACREFFLQTQKYRTALSYPILDSFPKIFSSASESKASIHTSLATTTQISAKIKTLRANTGRMVGMDEREELSSRLGEIAEAYEDGWHSGSESDSE